MQRPIVCITGIFIAFVAVFCRLDLRNLTGEYVGVVTPSLQAWGDIIDITIMAGLAVGAVGWLVPPRK